MERCIGLKYAAFLAARNLSKQVIDVTLQFPGSDVSASKYEECSLLCYENTLYALFPILFKRKS